MGRKQVFSFHERIGVFMRWWLAVLGMMTSTTATTTAAYAEVATKAEKKDLNRFLEALYKTYDSNNPATSWSRTIGEEAIFAPSTLALIRENERLLKGEAGVIGADVFCACQDFMFVKFIRGEYSATRAASLLHVSLLLNRDNQALRLSLLMERSPQGWRVFDVIMPDDQSMRELLETKNRQLSQPKPKPTRQTAASRKPTPAKPATAAKPAARTAQSQVPARASATPPLFRMDLPDTTGRTGSFGAENGWFDYIEGDDESEEKAQRNQGDGGGGGYDGSGSYDSGSGGIEGLPAPAGTVWAYGRNRWVIQPGGRCGPETQLVKGYCFGAVTAYMRRNPKVKSVVAITLSHPTPPGTWISRDTPIRYGYVEVYRNKDGSGFHADKHLTGTAKVKTPLGCHFSPLQEGFVLAAPGPQGLQEAALFRCP